MQNSHPMSSFTRGSQIFMHALRMIEQGTKAIFVVSAMITGCWFIWQCCYRLKLYDLYHFVFERIATFKLEMGQFFYHPQGLTISIYDFDEHVIKTFDAMQYKNMVWNSGNGLRLIKFCNWLTAKALFEAILIFSACIFISYVFFVLYGRKSMVKSKTRGGDLVTTRKLAFMLKSKEQASNITISNLPLVRDSERQHLLITGTTGTGKTNLLHELIPQIKARGEKAIVVDLNGNFIRPYFTTADLMLNPFDKRSINWNPWIDCHNVYDYDSLAKALVGESSHRDPFWDNSAIKIIAEALRQFKESKDLSKMLHLLNIAPLEEYSDFFSNTSVAAITSKEGDKTTTSIRATINDKTKPINYLLAQNASNDFSLKNYVSAEDNSWLFITAMPEQRISLLPLITAWLEILLCGLMQREPSANNSNIWFIMDELPAFGKIPSLKTALAESRQYGGCIVSGIQNIHQLMHIYGHNEALDLLDQFNTKFIFRVGDPKTASIAASMLGEQETSESRESLSYGANSMRDGVNINTIERRQQLVIPTEVMSLPNLSCYVKLAGNWPVTKLSMKYHKKIFQAERFIKRDDV